MPFSDPAAISLLRLTLTPGLGPILIRRAIATFGSADALLVATESSLRRVKGIGEEKARTIAESLKASAALAERELEAADRLGISMLSLGTAAYPPLLAQIPDPPPILYVRGRIDAAENRADRYPIAIVGSRSCTAYGTEQAGRFASALAEAGLTIISGGARGIDTAAHRAALRARTVGGQARTIAVLGCGLADCYPPDNRDLFDQIVAADAGAIVSELPLATPPNAENFPARNRIISGLALGVLVIEAGRRSGALITARLAAEDHNREVFALPGRVDSASSQGSLDLVKAGGTALVTHPDDILEALESPARHLYMGTHEARYASSGLFAADAPEDAKQLADGDDGPRQPTEPNRQPSIRDATLTDPQRAILAALHEPMSMDALGHKTGLDPGALRAEVTMLELRRRLQRRGTFIAPVT